jgi:hypothetical protein
MSGKRPKREGPFRPRDGIEPVEFATGMPQWLASSDLTLAEMRVLLAIVSKMRKPGRPVAVSNHKLVKTTGLHVTTVIGAIAGLWNEGLVESRGKWRLVHPSFGPGAWQATLSTSDWYATAWDDFDPDDTDADDTHEENPFATEDIEF